MGWFLEFWPLKLRCVHVKHLQNDFFKYIHSELKMAKSFYKINDEFKQRNILLNSIDRDMVRTHESIGYERVWLQDIITQDRTRTHDFIHNAIRDSSRIVQSDYGFKRVNFQQEKKTTLEEELATIPDVETTVEHKQCTICMSHEKNITLQCGHHRTCATCTLVLVKNKQPCPYCRKKIVSVLRTFD